ncbi:MAG: protein-disulfide reductase DsbD family protein [Planctomycetota bacterium]
MLRRFMIAAWAATAWVLGAFGTASAARADEAAAVKGEHLQVRLVAEQSSIAGGATLRLGVLFVPDAHWHVYWREPGETGLAPVITWRLPEGFRAGPIAWPVPTPDEVDDIHSHIYEERVLLACDVQVPFDVPLGDVTLEADVEWLVCEDSQGCLPGEAQLALTLPVRDAIPPPSPEAPWFEEARKQLPLAQPEALSVEIVPEGLRLTATGEGPWRAEDARLGGIWATWTSLDTSAAPIVVRSNDRIVLTWPLRAGAPAPTWADGLFVVERGEELSAWQVRGGEPPARTPAAPVAHTPAPEPAVALPPAAPADDDLSWATPWVRYDGAAVDAESAGRTPEDATFLGALVLALLGGMLLNIMPCVLPVLSLKILGFVDQAGSNPRAARLHGMAFGVGVVASFLALAGLLLLLRSRSQDLGWGFQLQEPSVVMGLAVLMFLVALNLSGVFEVGAGLAGLAGRAAQTTKHGSYAGSLWMGVLATVIATPCTAPFMGPAIGYAITQPAVQALGVFAAIGVGMALPYVVLSTFPGWLRFLPRPGPWMETFRQITAFPMYATVIWLVWLFGRLVGTSGMTALLVALLAVALGAWFYGRFATPVRSARTRWIVGRAMALSIAAAGILYVLDHAKVDASSESAQVATAPEGWVPYDGRRIAASQEAGVPVFLDFTADWCLTCKANEAAFLDTDSVRGAFKRHGVLAMQGDWTRRDERITKALAQLDTLSVPLYVIVPPDPARPAYVLRTAITSSYVVEALDKILGAP